MFVLRAHLRHLAIVSWAVPRERIAAMLPNALEPDPIDPQGKWALFSMAAMLDTTVRESYAQVNERTYVRRRGGGGEGAYFWKSHADSSQADFFRAVLGIPEFHEDVGVEVRDGIYVCTFRGRVVLRINTKQEGRVPQRYKGLNVDIARAWEISKNPLIGYTLDWGELCATPVRHDLIVGQPVSVDYVDPRFMVPSITLDPDQVDQPIFAAYQSETPFHIVLPPRPVGGWCALVSKVFYPLRP
jgi:uncharacterized protein DUF2071